jgi:hypothetical protein
MKSRLYQLVNKYLLKNRSYQTKCKCCNNTLSLTALETRFYNQRGYNFPKICRKCSAMYKNKNEPLVLNKKNNVLNS